MLEQIKALIDNFDTYVKYLKISEFEKENFEVVYAFDTNLHDEMTVRFESFDTKNDAITIFNSDIKQDKCWVQTNKTSNYIFVVFGKNGKFVIKPDYSCVYTNYNDNYSIINFQLPLDKNDYFNILVQCGIELSFESLIDIYNFMEKNKDIIKQYNLEFEIS